jgi:uncharacterized membrane protein
MKYILQGKWLGHPLHPITAHLSVALWPAALLLDVLTRFWPGNLLVQLSFACIALGLAAALLAIPTGLADWWEIKRGKPAWTIGLYHLILNAAVTLLFAVNLAIRVPTLTETSAVSAVALGLSTVGTLLLIASAYLGGLMIYDHGVGVARTSKAKWRKMAESSGANVPEPD